MNNTIKTLLLCLFAPLSMQAQVQFAFQGERHVSSPRCLYVNPDKKSAPKKFTFATVKEALLYAESQEQSTPWTSAAGAEVEIYIEPSVYWMDDPDDVEVRRPKAGNTPFALEVRLNRVRMIGMSENAEDVVLAVNRGHTQGAEGNFTMLHIIGSGVEARNITFGNYCNVDLVYPRNPRLNRPRRKEAIVQAQLVNCEGDNYKLDNCRFISRLNLCPFVGGRTVEFQDCYFECTDDALCGTGTYRQCRFTFFSSKPFYTTSPQGARFIDCDIHSKVRGTQYLTKASGPISLERCRWTSDDPNLRIEWTKRPDPRHLCLMKDCTLNGQPLDLPTPTEPLPIALPAVGIANQPEIIPGTWTIDCYKPSDTRNYSWQADNSRNPWGYAEGQDGAEGQWGMVQLQRGARLMFTPRNERAKVDKQSCIVTLDPCKSAGQGFGSATGQYLDVCIKFDTRTLTGYGLRFIRTPEYDKAVEVWLVKYQNGEITRLGTPERCDLFKAGCKLTLEAEGTLLTATITNTNHPELPDQRLSATMPHPNSFGGFHLQHTGTVGAGATVVRSIILK